MYYGQSSAAVRARMSRNERKENMDLIAKLTESQLKKDAVNFEVGDTVRVHAKIKEGNRERIQVFEGTVIAMKHGGIQETFTVRRVSYGVGVEKAFPVLCPNL